MALVFQLIVLLFSVMVHEIAHGATALALGDPTAKQAGRLTLNPLRHLDPVGSVILPLLLAIPVLFGARPLIIGWAKPVPYNPYRLKNPRIGAGLIGAAGPLTNLALAVVFGLLARLVRGYAFDAGTLELLFSSIAAMNIMLAVFNLIPIPPLDGASVLFAFMPRRGAALEEFLRRNGFFILLFVIFFGLDFLRPVVAFLYEFIVGGGF